MTTTATAVARTETCSECGATYTTVMGRRYYALLSHMMNAGEMTVGDARSELAGGHLDPDSTALLSGWVLSRASQGDDWRAGDPVRLPDGRVVAYADEGRAATNPEDLVQTGDETWGFES